jgi:hypothetical protein
MRLTFYGGVGVVGFVIAVHNPALAGPVYCSTWNGIRTCSWPGDTTSTDTQ